VGALISIYTQQENVRRQRFEDHFFNLLGNLQKERDGIKTSVVGNKSSLKLFDKAKYFRFKRALRDSKRDYYGRKAFEVIFYRLREEIGQDGYRDSKSVARKYKITIANHGQYRNYFRLLYHTCRFIETNGAKDRDFYIQVLRASLSNSEIGMICYNCAIDAGQGEFARLARKFRLFHNFKSENLDPYEIEELDFFYRRLGKTPFSFDEPIEVSYNDSDTMHDL
jgi:hypothetical protein